MKPPQPKRASPVARPLGPYRVAPEREEAQLRRKLLRKLVAARIPDGGKPPSAGGGSCDSENGQRKTT